MRVMVKHQATNRFTFLLATALAMQLRLPATAAEAGQAIPAESRQSLGKSKAPPLPSPQNWPPTRTATLRGKTEADLTINGRSCELFQHGVKPEWGYPAPQRDAFVVIHPKRERKNAPLYVVLHSAGHDVIKSVSCTRDAGNHDLYRSPDDFYALYLDCRGNAGDWWWGGMHSKDPNLTRRNSGGDPTPVEKRVIGHGQMGDGEIRNRSEPRVSQRHLDGRQRDAGDRHAQRRCLRRDQGEHPGWN